MSTCTAFVMRSTTKSVNSWLHDAGQGVVTTRDGGEKANYTFIQVGKTDEDRLCSMEYRSYGIV